jgi:hypothetical protein
VGAGVGLAGERAAGTGNAPVAGRTAQQRYDFGYQQCRYAKGHKVPVAGRYDDNRHITRRNASVPPPPPPPPGKPQGIPPDYKG